MLRIMRPGATTALAEARRKGCSVFLFSETTEIQRLLGGRAGLYYIGTMNPLGVMRAQLMYSVYTDSSTIH